MSSVVLRFQPDVTTSGDGPAIGEALPTHGRGPGPLAVIERKTDFYSKGATSP